MDLAITARVVSRRQLVPGQVVELVLAPHGADPLPDWEPGAHIDVILPSGLIRQYSLCGRRDSGQYTVAVLREPESRGGSPEIHESVQVGDELMLRGPRNHFRFVDAPTAVFIAGGIGITPLIPMIWHCSEAGIEWHLHYGGRSRASMAYVEDLQDIPGGSVTTYAQDEVGLIPLSTILADAPRDAVVYACGPEPLLTALEAEGGRAGVAIHLERFGPSQASASSSSEDTEFTVTLQRSARSLPVPVGARLIDVVREVLPMVPFSCEEGYCGSCETVVLEGIPDHRDSVLDDQERAANNCMMICVGRSKTPSLVLDL